MERRNFDSVVLLVVKAVEKATSGLIYMLEMSERKRQDKILT